MTFFLIFKIIFILQFQTVNVELILEMHDESFLKIFFQIFINFFSHQNQGQLYLIFCKKLIFFF
jgi:hypothetical protein